MLILLAGGVLVIAVAFLAVSASGRGSRESSYAPLLVTPDPVPIDAATEAKIRAFCGDCHALPRPESYDRDFWHDRVEAGYRQYGQSGRTDLDPPPMGQVVAYFRSLAPESLAQPQLVEIDRKYRDAFKTEDLRQEPLVQTQPAIAGLDWVSLRPGEPPRLLASDMMSGRVIATDPNDPSRPPQPLAQLNNPCHMEPCDLDEDGAVDLLVADLGSFGALDHDRGRVVWLRQDASTGEFRTVILASRLGRVTDARPIDADCRGGLDVIVAEFGWQRTGGIVLLRNVSSRGETPRFDPERLDPRSGPIHVPVGDLDGDGDSDFLALVSNEHESIEAFLNQGNGDFLRRALWRAPDLAFGSSGIRLCDLNGDGASDILYANGDAFDNQYLCPWFGVQWLENSGSLQYRYHRIADLPGACVASADDFDRDGDLDVLAVCFVPSGLKPATVDFKVLPSIVLYEQAAPGRFVPHTLERGLPCHAALVVADFNGDGHLDFAVGNHLVGAGASTFGPAWGTVWWNQGVSASQPR